MRREKHDFVAAATSLPRRRLIELVTILELETNDPPLEILSRTLRAALDWTDALQRAWQLRDSILERTLAIGNLSPRELKILHEAEVFFDSLTSYDLAVAALDTSKSFFEVVRGSQDEGSALSMVNSVAMLSFNSTLQEAHSNRLEKHLAKTRKKLESLQPGSFSIFESKMRDHHRFRGDWSHLQQLRDTMLGHVEKCEEMLLEIQIYSVLGEALGSQSTQEEKAP